MVQKARLQYYICCPQVIKLTWLLKSDLNDTVVLKDNRPEENNNIKES